MRRGHGHHPVMIEARSANMLLLAVLGGLASCHC
jgi:hypothetical protein